MSKSSLVDQHPEIAHLVHADLVRGLKNPKTGRRGRLSGMQVLMALVTKQMNGFSYLVTESAKW